MFEATKQFFAKNKPSSTSLREVDQKSCKQFEISNEISITHIKNGMTVNNKTLYKKSIQKEDSLNNSTSPTHKNMDQWLTSQSMIPSIEENGLLTESASEIEGMIEVHMKNEFKSALCFDMPQQIFYDLD